MLKVTFQMLHGGQSTDTDMDSVRLFVLTDVFINFAMALMAGALGVFADANTKSTTRPNSGANICLFHLYCFDICSSSVSPSRSVWVPLWCFGDSPTL